jgi:hypothetical protein
MPELPYLAELKSVLTDNAVRKDYFYRILRKKGVKVKDGWFNDPIRKASCSCASNAFGEVRFGDRGEEYYWRVRLWERTGWRKDQMPVDLLGGEVYERCGVEILGMRPNATKHTYSGVCDITLKDLKQACKDNSIKKVSTMKKIDLLRVLMGV